MGARSFTRGDLVAKGNTSDVFRWTSTTVVKVLRPGIPVEWAAQEAQITRSVHAAGLPAPAVDGLVEVDGRTGIVFEHVDGRSMWATMKATPRELPQLVESMVGLQQDLHRAGPIDGVSELVARACAKIDAATVLPLEDRRAARSLLERLPTATALCHGDMHPANILMSSRGLIVVDWFDAANGHPTADLARSSLLMRPTAPSRSVRAFLGGATRAFLARLHGAYLDALERRSDLEEAHFATWEAVLAVARLAEPVTPGDLADVWAAYKAGAPADLATTGTGPGAGARRPDR